MPIFIMGLDGELLYYNEPAEPILGQRFEEAGPMPREELADTFQTTAEDGSPLDADDLPISIALTKRRPAHLPFRICGLDGVWRKIEVTAFPIEGQGDRHLGAVAIFWEAQSK
jgi:PAS domain-containing protein